MKLKFCQTARLDVCYHLEYFFAEVKIFRFWPKTMDYNPGFFFWQSEKKLRKACLLNVHEKTNLMALVSVA